MAVGPMGINTTQKTYPRITVIKRVIADAWVRWCLNRALCNTIKHKHSHKRHYTEKLGVNELDFDLDRHIWLTIDRCRSFHFERALAS